MKELFRGCAAYIGLFEIQEYELHTIGNWNLSNILTILSQTISKVCAGH